MVATDDKTNEFIEGVYQMVMITKKNGGKSAWAVNSLVLADLAQRCDIDAFTANTILYRMWYQNASPT
jgi:hypothetical protein